MKLAAKVSVHQRLQIKLHVYGHLLFLDCVTLFIFCAAEHVTVTQ